MDRFLVAPTNRGALMVGRIAPQVLTTIIQSLILVGLALAVGATFPGGAAGIVMLIVCAALLSVGFSMLSNGLALMLRREESVIAAVNFILLPLTFLSSAFLQQSLAPKWIQQIARYNPVNWAVQAGRDARLPELPAVGVSHTPRPWASGESRFAVDGVFAFRRRSF
jgi:ABC-2 type transport system permease protein